MVQVVLKDPPPPKAIPLQVKLEMKPNGEWPENKFSLITFYKTTHPHTCTQTQVKRETCHRDIGLTLLCAINLD